MSDKNLKKEIEEMKNTMQDIKDKIDSVSNEDLQIGSYLNRARQNMSTGIVNCDYILDILNKKR